jgi:hypothetical protein
MASVFWDERGIECKGKTKFYFIRCFVKRLAARCGLGEKASAAIDIIKATEI